MHALVKEKERATELSIALPGDMYFSNHRLDSLSVKLLL